MPDAQTVTHTLHVDVTGDAGGRVVSQGPGIDCGADCDETYVDGDLVRLDAELPAGAAMYWAGDCGISTGTCELVMDDDMLVIADLYFPGITVTPLGTGTGTVTSLPAGIDCGDDCTEVWPVFTEVVLTATADDGSYFVGWGQDACGGTEPCTIEVPDQGGAFVSAQFDTNPVLQVFRSGNGSGTITSSPAGIDCGATCMAAFPFGTQVTLTATADVTSTFAGWTGACSGTGTCTLTVDGLNTATAVFTSQILTVAKNGNGAGTVTSSPAGIDCGATCTAGYPTGTQVTLTATPGPTSEFEGWSAPCSGTGTCTVTMDAAHTVTATFAMPILTVTKAGMGGGAVVSSPVGIDCGGTCAVEFARGTVVTLTSSEDPLSTFTGWSGACSGTGVCTVTMDTDHSVTATYSFDNGDTTFTATKQGNPLWDLAGFEAWSTTSDYATQWQLLWSQHQYNVTWNAYQPSVVHAPPYDVEVANRLPSQGWDAGNVFRVAHWTNGRLLSFAGVIVPSAGAPVGSTADYASGPYIPKGLQLYLDADMYKDATIVDPDFDGPYPLLTQLLPGTPVDGWSHMTLTMGEGTPWVAGTAGSYHLHIHVYEMATPANGWVVDIPFTIVN